MKRLLSFVLLTMALSVHAAETDHGAMKQDGQCQQMMKDGMPCHQMDGPMKLKDGSLLFVNNDGTMRMVDKTGQPITMKEGVEMELADGSVVMMQNKKVWRHVHQDMKK